MYGCSDGRNGKVHSGAFQATAGGGTYFYQIRHGYVNTLIGCLLRSILSIIGIIREQCSSLQKHFVLESRYVSRLMMVVMLREASESFC